MGHTLEIATLYKKIVKTFVVDKDESPVVVTIDLSS